MRLLDPIVRVHNALHHYKHLCGSTVPTVPDKPPAQTVHSTGAPSFWNSIRTRDVIMDIEVLIVNDDQNKVQMTILMV